MSGILPANARIVLYGPSGSGKTALLYRLKTGNFVANLPTLVGNIERFSTRDPHAEWEVRDVAGGRNCTVTCYMRAICTPETIVLFTIDPSNSNDLNANIEDELIAALRCEFKFLIVLFTQRDREEVTEEDVSALKQRVMKVISGGAIDGSTRSKCVVWDDLDALSAKTGAQTDELLERLAHVARTGSVPKQEMPPKPTDEELLRRIEEGDKNPMHKLEPDEFLRRMEAGDVEGWDHMCYLRAGFLCLGECITREMPVFSAAGMLEDKLDKMLQAKPGKFPITKHRTSTIFWLYRIFFAMASYRTAHGVFPSADCFRGLLLKDPDLMDSRSWAQYYTRNLLFSPEARNAWRLPDLQPLPTLTYNKITPVPPKQTKPNRTADILKRYAYAILKMAESTNQRRATIINDTFPMIQSHIMRLRAESVDGLEPYSETHAYFWTQMIHAAAHSVPPDSVPDITKLSYESFRVLFPELLGSDDIWKEYYTSEQWNSIEARARFILPKLKPLPNVLCVPGKDRLEESVRAMLDEKFSPHAKDSPSAEELFLKVHWAVKSTAESMDENVIPDTHAKLIRRIFDRLVSKSPVRDSFYVGEAWTAVSHLVSGKRVTKAVFWSQMVVNAFRNMKGRFHGEVVHFRAAIELARKCQPEDVAYEERTRTGLFKQFLTVNPELVWEDLWRVYYSDETWNSEDARKVYVLPDRIAIPAYVEQVDVEIELPSKEEHGEWEMV